MTIIATELQRPSSVVAHEYEPAMGYCREVVSVTVVAGMKLGAVLDNTGALVTATNAANASYVLIDERVKDLAAGTYSLLVLARGPVMLKDLGLSYDATVNDATKRAAVATALAAKGMLVVKAI